MCEINSKPNETSDNFRSACTYVQKIQCIYCHPVHININYKTITNNYIAIMRIIFNDNAQHFPN